MNGKLFFHSETGTEGGFWAFQDEKHIKKDPTSPTGEAWSYEGLHILKEGDRLTIYSKENTGTKLWEGKIKLKQLPLFTETVRGGWWIHADQVGMNRDLWARFFFEGYPAKLIKTRSKRAKRQAK